MAVKTCWDCKKEFEYQKGGRYVKKYCDKCSAKRKKAYASIHNIKASDCEE